ncbi:MAG: hypothetical protein IKT42_00745 [Clostridia bacterium]|nr:hypothetical protein [Clostridia bacterium]
MLCPAGSINKSVRYVFCLCFICCIIGVATNISVDFSWFNVTKTDTILTEQNVGVTAQMVFGEALKAKNINFRKIVIDTNKLNDGSIVINRVTVYTSETSQKVLDAIGSDSYEVMVVNE